MSVTKEVETFVEEFAARMKDKFGLDMTVMEKYEFMKAITKRDKERVGK